MNALKKIMLMVAKDERNRFRDRRAFYASDAGTCARDLYWSMTGEPITNPTDFMGKMKMAVGKAVETVLIGDILKGAHQVGLHFLGEQIQVGGSNPNWDGSLDALVYESENNKRYVIEIKTKSGFGAEMFRASMDPGDSYLGQIGLYLKDLSEKGITAEGCFIFVLLCDKFFGDMVQVDCKYDPATKLVTAYRGTGSWGDTKILDYTFDTTKPLAKFKAIEEAVRTKTVPQPEFTYKRELTPEFLAEQSDYTLKAMIGGNKVAGNWQPRYSKFFQKQLETDGVSREYTSEEMQLIKNEYNSRKTPTGKIRKQVA